MSDTRIVQYIEQLEQLLTPLTPTERQEIVAEVRSHLSECSTSGPDALTRALAGFGHPESYARAYLEDASLRQALASGAPAALWTNFLRQAPRRFLALAGFVMVSLIYLVAASLILIAVMEIIAPARTGLWIGPGMNPFFLGLIAGEGPPEGVTELLGLWVFPVTVTLGAVFAVIGLAMSRWIAARLIRRG